MNISPSADARTTDRRHDKAHGQRSAIEGVAPDPAAHKIAAPNLESFQFATILNQMKRGMGCKRRHDISIVFFHLSSPERDQALGVRSAKTVTAPIGPGPGMPGHGASFSFQQRP